MKQELLSPAGNLEAGYAALFYGADAVYLGLRKFSARAGAENFDEHDLDVFSAYAHHLGRKVYAAVNTLIQEEELPDLLTTLDICARCRVDGIILQDLGLARILRESYPQMELHASTQMAVHNKEGALFLKQLGFKRVVLARELTLAEIQEIAAIDGLETEAFIHGALCYSYSGLCQFSALETGRSANRGKCTYPCRACFKGESGEKHFFSMKDMALQADVLKLPVTSLKIEGRKKSPLYVAAVTDYYRRILDGKGDDPTCAENIRQIFSRPWCKFHLNGKDKNIIDVDFVGHRGLPVGRIEKTAPRRLSTTLTHRLGRYDGLQIDVPGREKPFGFSVQNMRVKGHAVFEADAGTNVEIELPPTTPPLKAGWMLYLASSTAVKGGYNYAKPKPDAYRHRQETDVRIRVAPTQLEAFALSAHAVITGEFGPAEQAQKVAESFRQAFEKTGGTSLQLRRLEVENPQNCFVPLSMMNALRRALYAQIRPEESHGSLPPTANPVRTTHGGWIIRIDRPEYVSLTDLSLFEEVQILLQPNLMPKDLSALPKKKIRLVLPAVCRRPKIFESAVERLIGAGYRKWEVANYWGLSFLPIEQVDISFDSPLYTLNTQAMMQARQIGARRVTFAPEDTKSNLMLLSQKAPLETALIVYQDAPLFTSAACIRPNDCAHCPKGEKRFELEKDGRHYQAVSKDCQLMLFNRAPLCVAAETKDVAATYRRADFCFMPYSPETVRAVVDRLMRFENVPDSRQANINSAQI